MRLFVLRRDVSCGLVLTEMSLGGNGRGHPQVVVSGAARVSPLAMFRMCFAFAAYPQRQTSQRGARLDNYLAGGGRSCPSKMRRSHTCGDARADASTLAAVFHCRSCAIRKRGKAMREGELAMSFERPFHRHRGRDHIGGCRDWVLEGIPNARVLTRGRRRLVKCMAHGRVAAAMTGKRVLHAASGVSDMPLPPSSHRCDAGFAELYWRRCSTCAYGCAQLGVGRWSWQFIG